MTIYTHNCPMNYEVTNIRMIVTTAPREVLGISEDWVEVNPDDVAFIEELTGREYPESEGWQKLFIERREGVSIEKWGRL